MTGLNLRLPMRGRRTRLEATGERDRVLIVRLLDERAVGSVVLSVEDDGRALAIRALCVDAESRGYGAGSEAARLVIEGAERAGYGLRAWAPPERGLAVYFWFRMGFRPLFGEGPGGGIWFERALSEKRTIVG